MPPLSPRRVRLDQERSDAPLRLHVAKLAGAFAAPHAPSAINPRVWLDNNNEDVLNEPLGRRLPDVLLFGLKIPTVFGQRLAGSTSQPRFDRRAPSRPVPRSGPYEAYWRLAAERQRVFFSRLRGEPAPWADDEIVATYKFCNAYRASDRVSQFLIRDVIYAERAGGLAAEDVLLHTVMFRLFSKESTWLELEAALGEPLCRASWDAERIDEVLERRREVGTANCTSAFILCVNDAYGRGRKHRNHLALLDDMFGLDGGAGKLPRVLADADSLAELNDALRAYPLIGPFMAYQLAIDKYFIDRAAMSPAEVIGWMTGHQAEEFDRLGIDFAELCVGAAGDRLPEPLL